MQRRLQPQHTQAFFVKGVSPFARLVVFSALSLVLMATDARLKLVSDIRLICVTLLTPLQAIANAPAHAFRNTSEFLTSHQTLLKQNRALQLNTLQLSTELQRMQTLAHENAHLRSLLEVKQSRHPVSQVGEILHMGRDPFVHHLVINLGAQHGILSGQAVVDAVGVIGQVTRVYPYSSEVTLITDQDLAIPVQIERNALRAIAFGHGRDGTLDLPYLPANVDIRQGDRLVTSGIDGVYPNGLAVAEVIRVETNASSPFAHIVCKPLAGVHQHKQVLLLGMQAEVAMPSAPEPIRSHENSSENKTSTTFEPNPTMAQPSAPTRTNTKPAHAAH